MHKKISVEYNNFENDNAVSIVMIGYYIVVNVNMKKNCLSNLREMNAQNPYSMHILLLDDTHSSSP